MEQTTKKGKVSKFFEEVTLELKKVSWPNKRDLYGATTVVLVVVILLSIGVGVLDAILGQIMQLLIQIGT